MAEKQEAAQRLSSLRAEDFKDILGIQDIRTIKKKLA